MTSPSSRQNQAATIPARQPQLHGSAQADQGSINQWEAAYLRFETSEQEIQKFIDRLEKIGADQWPRDAAIVELFCGRGNGLRALQRLGFMRLAGVDLSSALIEQYSGPAQCCVSDCRRLPFQDSCKDILIIQGGLHHLPMLPDDLEQTLKEMRRILKPEGRVLLVEPWLTPFLSFVHSICSFRVVRRLSTKIDALATMIEFERHTYEQWLGQPQQIVALLQRYFHGDRCDFRWGKLWFLGRKAEISAAEPDIS